MMSSALICGAVRTPFANVNSHFREYSAAGLAALPLQDMLKRNPDLEWRKVDRMYVGSNNKNLSAAQTFRDFVSDCLRGTDIDGTVEARQFNYSYCSGMAALAGASQDVELGESQFSVVVGVSSQDGLCGRDANSQRASFARDADDYTFARLATKSARRALLAKKYRISDASRDAFTVATYANAATARHEGFFDRECMLVPRGEKSAYRFFSEDELQYLNEMDFAPSAAVDQLVRIRPALRQGFAPAAEGACCLILASPSCVSALGLRPRVRIIAHAAMENPVDLDSPYSIPAVQSVFAQTGLSAADLDVIEVSEVCAVEVLSVMRHLNVSLTSNKVNGYGGDLAVGEAAGASSARLVLTAINKLQSNNLRYALCAASSEDGRGVAILLENITES